MTNTVNANFEFNNDKLNDDWDEFLTASGATDIASSVVNDDGYVSMKTPVNTDRIVRQTKTYYTAKSFTYNTAVFTTVLNINTTPSASGTSTISRIGVFDDKNDKVGSTDSGLFFEYRIDDQSNKPYNDSNRNPTSLEYPLYIGIRYNSSTNQLGDVLINQQSFNVHNLNRRPNIIVNDWSQIYTFEIKYNAIGYAEWAVYIKGERILLHKEYNILGIISKLPNFTLPLRFEIFNNNTNAIDGVSPTNDEMRQFHSSLISSADSDPIINVTVPDINVTVDPATSTQWSAFRTTDVLGGTLINNVGGYTAGEVSSITVNDTSSFGTSGIIYIGNEFIQYGSKTATTFNTLIRGIFNSTPASIADGSSVGEVYDTGVLDLRNFSQVATKVNADKVGQMRFAWYTDASGNDEIRFLSPPYLNINVYDFLSAPSFGPYVRYVFANNDASGNPQTNFYFETDFYSHSVSPQILTLGSGIFTGMTSLLVRSVLAGYNNTTNTYQNVGITTNNEILTNTLASNKAVKTIYSQTNVNAIQYAILIDLSNSVDYPHDDNINCVDIDTFSLSIKFNSGTASANIKVGIITRIDGTDSDISWLISKNPGVQNANDSINIYESYQPSAIKFATENGNLIGSVTNDRSIALTNVNSGITLSQVYNGTTVTPEVGDVVLYLGYIADTFDITVSLIYHSHNC